MEWILGAGSDIAVNREQLKARREFIETVTGSKASPWQPILENKFFHCHSNDVINGVFITAHIGDVMTLGAWKAVWSSKFVVANTCVWERALHKKLLHIMTCNNRCVELFFAKQELGPDANGILRRSATLNDVGTFGFQTSMSERELFSNRKLGLYKAIQKSFERVSLILLPGDVYA